MVQVIRNMSDSKDAQKKALNDNQKAAQEQLEKLPDMLELSQAMMHAYQESQPLFLEMAERFSKDFSKTNLDDFNPDPMNIGGASMDMMQALTQNPMKYWQLQMQHAQKQSALMQNSMMKFWGLETDPVIAPEKGDRRFKSDAWDESAIFDFIKQYYLLACDFVNETIETTEGLSDAKKKKLSFSAQLFMNALSPSNFLMTNPDILNETIQSGGENLIKGLQNLNEDLERGHGTLKISMTDYKAFKMGENIAATPGHVVYENDLIQLIQYEPQTDDVAKRPVLVVPPWINKYYILDLQPQSSYINWMVEQGHTVFCISWVNPDAKLAQKSFENYMNEGIITALDQIQNITGEPDCNAVGYCLGGTLLTTTLAYLHKKKQADRIASATFLTTLVDFEQSGDMKLFMDDEQIAEMEKLMDRNGVLPASQLKQTFSLLRANDLIWSFVVNNYLMGREPFPFDLLYWNDDATNMPAAMHSFYLKNMYRDNLLCKPGALEMNGVKIDVSKVKTPSYFLSTKEDHIAPWKATYETTQLFSGPKTFTLAASGHIAGVVNPPSKNKYCYWINNQTPMEADNWMNSAAEHDGSWWPHWQKWMNKYTGGKVKAKTRQVKKAIEPAPGRYVSVKSD